LLQRQKKCRCKGTHALRLVVQQLVQQAQQQASGSRQRVAGSSQLQRQPPLPRRFSSLCRWRWLPLPQCMPGQWVGGWVGGWVEPVAQVCCARLPHLGPAVPYFYFVQNFKR